MYPLLSSFSLPVVFLLHDFSSLSLYLHVYLTTNIPSSEFLPLSLLTTISSKFRISISVLTELPNLNVTLLVIFYPKTSISHPAV